MNLLAGLRAAYESVLDAVIPPKERTLRTRARHIEDLPLSPTVHELLGVRVTTIMEYRESVVQDLIRALKYDGSQHAARLIAGALADYLREEISALKQFSPQEILIVPVPLHRARERERGFNQIELVLKALPQEFKDGTSARLSRDSLERIRATPSQTRLARAERIKNTAGAFAVPDSGRARGSRIFLIDDVATTGATIKHAGIALEKSGAEVFRIALACA